MPEADTLSDLATELRALPGRQRQAILNSLTPAERSRMIALLNRPKAVPEVAAPPAERKFDNLSPWLSTRVQQAESATGPSDAPWKMTAATRQLLLKSAQELVEAAAPPNAPVPLPTSGRSLLGAIGGMLSQKRAVR